MSIVDNKLSALQHLLDVVAKLRSPDGGCPWDLAQTPETLIPYIIEEAYETVDAIRSGNTSAIVEELGDLLLQVVLQSQVASDRDQFTIAEVAEGIAQKLIRRHPHVFGDLSVDDMDEVHRNWERIKAAEKGEDPIEAQKLSRKLNRYGRSLPPLMAGMKISQKAAAQGFEWDNIEGVWDKFQEELSEFRHAISYEGKARQQAELGDLLFTVINIARWYDLDPTEALHSTNQGFIARIEYMESFASKPLSEHTLAELESLWQAAKQKLSE